MLLITALLVALSVLSTTLRGNPLEPQFINAKYFEKTAEFREVKGWIGLQHQVEVRSTISVVRSLIKYYNKRIAGLPYSVMSDPMFLNRINTLAERYEYRENKAIPDGLNVLVSKIGAVHLRREKQEKLAEEFVNKMDPPGQGDQEVPNMPETPEDSDSDSDQTPDTEPTPDTPPLSSDEEAENVTTSATTPSSAPTTATSATTSTFDDDDDNEENQDPDEEDPEGDSQSFLHQQQGRRNVLGQIDQGNPISDFDMDQMRPRPQNLPGNRRRRQVRRRLVFGAFTNDKVLYSYNMDNVPVDWIASSGTMIHGHGSFDLQTSHPGAQKLIDYIAGHVKNYMTQSSLGISLSTEMVLQNDEMRLLISYWCEHLLRRLEHTLEGQALTYLRKETLEQTQHEIINRTKQGVEVFDFVNITNDLKNQIPYIVVRNGFNYFHQFYVPVTARDYATYELLGETNQVKYDGKLYDLVLHNNYSVAIVSSIPDENSASSYMSSRLFKNKFKGAIPTMRKFQQKCTKIGKYFCEFNRLRPVLDDCLKALIEQEMHSFIKCAGQVVKSAQRVIRIYKNKYQFFPETKNASSVVTCTNNHNDRNKFGNIATITVNRTCPEIFYKEKTFTFEPSKPTCPITNNPCVKRVNNIVSPYKLATVLDELAKNPLQNSIDFFTTASTNFWNTHKTKIITTIAIILIIMTIAVLIFNFYKLLRCIASCCTKTSVRHEAAAEEVPLNQMTMDDLQFQPAPPYTSRTTQPVNPSNEDSVHTGSTTVYGPSPKFQGV